jgi:hypothetical protein
VPIQAFTAPEDILLPQRNLAKSEDGQIHTLPKKNRSVLSERDEPVERPSSEAEKVVY